MAFQIKIVAKYIYFHFLILCFIGLFPSGTTELSNTSEHTLLNGSLLLFREESLELDQDKQEASSILRKLYHEPLQTLISDWLLIVLIPSAFLLQAFTLFVFGQPLISKSGKVKVWDGNIYGSENSQHLTDWYTFTHIIHGFLFYAITSFLLPHYSLKKRYLVSLGSEVAWEIAENSPTIIERYRSTALAQGYTGDTILNSLCDTLTMSAGFVLASKLPPLVVIIIGILEEVIVGNAIHDNFTLNVLQLIHPFEAISRWQLESANYYSIVKKKDKINKINKILYF